MSAMLAPPPLPPLPPAPPTEISIPQVLVT
jgi:hypothetical protein